MFLKSLQNLLLLSGLTSCLLAGLKGQAVSNQLFDNSFLHEIRVNSNGVLDFWNGIAREYAMVDMTIDGNGVDSVGLKMQGSTSASSEQKPLELDFNVYVLGGNYNGLKKINLRNNFKDVYLQKEALAYDLYRRAGLPSPKTAFAEVYVDEIFRGIYSVTEMIDKTFLKNNFASNDGSLYKGEFGHRGFSIAVKEGSMKEFDHFDRNLRTDNLDEFLNFDNYLKQLATDIIIGDWDSYAYYRHNYYVYYEARSERLNFINWDHNYAFEAKPEAKDVHPVGTYPAYGNLFDDPDLRRKYEQVMCELLKYQVDDNYIRNRATYNYELINGNVNDVVAADPEPLIEYISMRKQRLQDTLAVIGIECGDMSCPINPGDLVINEFVTSNDINIDQSGIDGGSPDWIEIFNTTDSDITLDKHYYLSNDKSFPKKWNFTEGVTIPDGGYLIVWADKKLQSPGIHAGFKLDKSGGDVLLTYEDLTEIDAVHYEDQDRNEGYVRFPNGKGPFIKLSPSLQTSNSKIIPVEGLSAAEGVLYLSTDNDLISIESDQPVTDFVLSDSIGKAIQKISNPKFPLSLESYQKGTYIVKFDLNGNSYTVEIVKE